MINGLRMKNKYFNIIHKNWIWYIKIILYKNINQCKIIKKKKKKKKKKKNKKKKKKKKKKKLIIAL